MVVCRDEVWVTNGVFDGNFPQPVRKKISKRTLENLSFPGIVTRNFFPLLPEFFKAPWLESAAVRLFVVR